jgi:HD-GYP domain-containing protein (c-di-GMP phosphodiesterase class II)
MRSISTFNLQPDMVVGRNIFSSKGDLLLAEGLTLTSHFIGRLRQLGISAVYVEDEESAGILASDAVPEHTRRQALATVYEGFTSVVSQDNLRPAQLPMAEAHCAVDEIMAALIADDTQVYNVVSVKTYDEYTYQHCVNVAVLSIIVGISLGLTESRIIKLGIGAMLHDIGKMYVPLEILNKPSRLEPDEFDIIKKHPRFGFEVVKNDPALSPLSANVVLRHHEKVDGSGYPDGLGDDELHLFARIVAAADVYDAVTSNRPYRVPMKPADAVRVVVCEAASQLDATVVAALCRHIPPCPIGCGVLLSDGTAGLVVSYQSEDPLSPTVRILFSSSGRKLPDFYELDLQSEKRLKIVDSAPDGSDESLARFYSEEVVPAA